MNIFDIPVHPTADIFPMIAKEEFAELVQDIKDNGVQEPIVVSEIGGVLTLIDGRNRREAAKKAGLKDVPTRDLNGTDPVQFIVSANLMRRQLSISQKAILHAMAKPKGEQGKSTSLPIKGSTPGDSTMLKARKILKLAPDIADDVLIGKTTINEADKTLTNRIIAQDSEHEKMVRLRDNSPDLAEQVDNGTLKFSEALAAYHQREADAKNDRVSMYNHIINGLYIFANECNNKQVRVEIVGLLDVKNSEFEEVTKVSVADTRKRLKAAARNLNKLIEEL